MGNQPLLHPTGQTLSNFSLDKLDDGQAEIINSHLKECADCQRVVAEMSSDSFLGRLRGAQEPSGKPNTGTQGPVMSDEPGPKAKAGTLPPDLADHPDYQIVRELGRGGMGVVYLAHNRLMGRDEVLKVVSKHLIERKGVLERFSREIRSAARLMHPNIVLAYSAFRSGESVVFAMEYVQGLDLAKLVKTKGPMSVAHASYFVHQAALGLQHAHEQDMVHRDIKPGNLMLTRKGDKSIVKVLDFSLAKATRESPLEGALTHEGQMLGTPDFIAPEQIRDAQSAGIQADIYSLGCTLYYLLTGGPPFEASSLYDLLQAHFSMDAQPLNLVRPEVPAELAALVAKMMAKDAGRRFQTPAEVAEALKPFFKKENAGSVGLKPEVSQADRAEAKRTKADTGYVPTQRAPNLVAAPSPPVQKPTETSRAALQWESLIDLKEVKPLTKAAPVVAERLRQRPPWVWPAIVAASLLSLVTLGIIIAIKTNTGETKITAPDDKPFKADVDDVHVEFNPSKIPAADRRAVAPGQVPAPKASRAHTRTAVVSSGNWRVDGNELIKESEKGLVLFGDPGWTDYDFAVDLMRERDAGGCALFYRTVIQDENHLDFRIAVDGDCQLDSYYEGKMRELRGCLFQQVSGKWYHALISVRGKRIVCSLRNDEGAEIVNLDAADRENLHPLGRVGLWGSKSPYRFKNIKVSSPDHGILWEGLPDRLVDLAGTVLWAGLPAIAKAPAPADSEALAGTEPGLKAGTAVITGGPTREAPDRSAASSVLSHGGSIKIRIDDNERTIKPGETLPGQPFQLTGINVADQPTWTDAELERIRGLDYLVTLDLSKDRNVTAAGLAHLQGLRRIETLNLDYVGVNDAGLSHLVSLTTLQTLGLRESTLTDAGAAQLVRLKHLKNLRLGSSQIRDSGLAHLARLPELESLGLANTRVSDAGLAHLSRFPKLLGVNLWDTPITDAGLKSFENMQQLESLTLGGTRVTDDGLTHLRRLTNLTGLGLDRLRVTDAGLVHLRGLNKLRGLDLGDTKATAAGVQRLSKELPACRIER
jgi:serine/threonine protein kinase